MSAPAELRSAARSSFTSLTASVAPLVPSATRSRSVSAATDVRKASRAAQTSPDGAVELPVDEDPAAGAVVPVSAGPAGADVVAAVVAAVDAESSSSPHDTIKTPSTTHATIARTSDARLPLGF